MRRVPAPRRVGVPPQPRRASRRIGPISSPIANRGAPVSVAGGASFILLALLFWLIFYQNLPPNLGLHGPSVGPATGTEDISTANTLDRIIKVCMLGVSIFVIASRWALTRSLAKNVNIGAVAFLVLCPVSALWSISPSDTILRFVTLASIVLVCFGISLAGWDRRRFQQLALPPLMFIAVVSLILGMLFPTEIMEIGDDLSLKNAWHGITLTKNQFGMAASLGVIICVNRLLAREGGTLASIAGAAAAFACLILSRSNTSLFATMLAILAMALLIRVPVVRQRYSTHLVVAIAGTLLLYEMVIQDVMPGAYTLLAPIRALTGKDATFSARTIIWDIIKEHIQAAPYLGTGYAAYWIGPVANSPSFVFTYKMYFYPTEAHNGYLDVVNDLGLLGLALLLAFLIYYMRQALQLLKFDRSQGALYLGILFQQMIMNMSESEWFARDSVSTILLLTITCMARGVYEGRLQARSTGAVAS